MAFKQAMNLTDLFPIPDFTCDASRLKEVISELAMPGDFLTKETKGEIQFVIASLINHFRNRRHGSQ